MDSAIEVIIYMVIAAIIGIGKLIGSQKEKADTPFPSKQNGNSGELNDLFDLFKEEVSKPLPVKEERFPKFKKEKKKKELIQPVIEIEQPPLRNIEPVKIEKTEIKKKSKALNFIKSNPRSAFLIKEILSTPKGLEN